MVQDLVETEGKLTAARSELQRSHLTLEQKHERLQEVEARSRELYDTTVRLEAHIADLESRKRAPLYQKKQEEELRAATEKLGSGSKSCVHLRISSPDLYLGRDRNLMCMPDSPSFCYAEGSCLLAV